MPLKGDPKFIKGMLLKIVNGLVEKPSVKEFYLGVTCDLITTKVNLNCDMILSLYETHNKDDAGVIHNELISYYSVHKKCINVGAQEIEKGSDYNVNNVFIGFWYSEEESK